MSVTTAHREYLRNSAAITDHVIDSTQIISTPEGIAFPWQGPGLEEGAYQLRPDNPVMDAKGRPVKYTGPTGVQLPFNRLRDQRSGDLVIIVEGTKQSLSVLSWTDDNYAVYGIAGCRSWHGLPLSWTSERDVVILFDGDMHTNRDVHDAAVAFREELEMAGAESVRFARIPSQGKQGIDDVLAAMPESQRRKDLLRWILNAKVSPGKPPAARSSSPFFDKNGLMVQTLASDILSAQPAALTAENYVAVYQSGVYRTDPMALMSEVSLRLGEQHRSTHTSSVSEAVKSSLYRERRVLPDKTGAPLANFLNTMVDLRTGAEVPHDPEFLSRIQHPVTWDAAAACPVYERWLMEVIPDQADDLEEVAGTMLDPSRTPSKALFAYGPSHSGKSTFLRLMVAVAGKQNSSAVTLHALADDRFAAANVYGKCLNASADLSPKDVSDLSAFKMMTGEDSSMANRKFGAQFEFTNTALFAFSANELPSVSESSRAYANRMKPFNFPYSFAGREDPSIEDKLMSELPGIVVRWAVAYRRFLARGGYLPTDVRVGGDFERKSDRVRQWVAEVLSVVAVSGRTVLPPTEATTATQLSALFSAWAKENGGHSIGRNKLVARLTSVDGVERVRIAPNKSWGLNVIVRPEGEQGFEEYPPVAKGGGGSGAFYPTTTDAGSCHDLGKTLVVGRSSEKVTLPPRAVLNPSAATPSAPEIRPLACEYPATVATVRGSDLDQGSDLDAGDSNLPPRVPGDQRPGGHLAAPGRSDQQGEGSTGHVGTAHEARGVSLPFTLADGSLRGSGGPVVPHPGMGDSGAYRAEPAGHRGSQGGAPGAPVDYLAVVRGDVPAEPGTRVHPFGGGVRDQARPASARPVPDAPSRGVGGSVPQGGAAGLGPVPGPSVIRPRRVNPFLPVSPEDSP